MANEKTMNARLQQKHDIAENWLKATNFIPKAGEIIVYDDLNKIKIGNGTTNVNELSFTNGGVGLITEQGGEIFNDYENNQAAGLYSHAEGQETTAGNTASHAEGYRTEATGLGSHAEGQDTHATGYNAHAEGTGTTSSGTASHTEGDITEAKGWGAHAEGGGTHAMRNYAHAEGFSTYATGDASHAEGLMTIAKGDSSHAEGYRTTASSEAAHSEGKNNISGIACFEMTQNIELHDSINNIYYLYLNNLNIDFKMNDTAYIAYDNKYYSCKYWNKQDTHIAIRTKEPIAINSNFDTLERKHLLILNKPLEGDSFIGIAAHSEGSDTHAIEDYSHTSGLGTIAIRKAQTAIGQYNASNTNALFIVGNGESNDTRSNAFTVNKDGNAYVQNNKKLATEEFVENKVADLSPIIATDDGTGVITLSFTSSLQAAEEVEF